MRGCHDLRRRIVARIGLVAGIGWYGRPLHYAGGDLVTDLSVGDRILGRDVARDAFGEFEHGSCGPVDDRTESTADQQIAGDPWVKAGFHFLPLTRRVVARHHDGVFGGPKRERLRVQVHLLRRDTLLDHLIFSIIDGKASRGRRVIDGDGVLPIADDGCATGRRSDDQGGNYQQSQSIQRGFRHEKSLQGNGKNGRVGWE